MYNSKKDTEKHSDNVMNVIFYFNNELYERGMFHDHSKLQCPEKEIFDKFTPRLKDATYGSDEYNEFLKEMKVALDHHYKNNSHHPEHYEDGINGMNLFDFVEMFCDWCSATLRHDDGNLIKSIEINQKRFNYSDDIKNIMLNTVEQFKKRNLCK